MTNTILSLFAIIAIGCGVKGPPEPPLPTEASLKKEVLPAAQEASESSQQTEKPSQSKQKSKAKGK